MQKYKKGNKSFCISNNTFNYFLDYLKKIIININFLHSKKFIKEPLKIATQPPTQKSPSATTFQDFPTAQTTSQTNHPQSSTRISFHENPYTFEETHSLLSESLEPVDRNAPLSEPQYEPTYNIYPSLEQGLNRTRHASQNQNTPTINRQIIHPRRNRNFTTPRVHFSIPSSSITNPLDLSNSSVQSAPNLLHIKTKQTYYGIT